MTAAALAFRLGLPGIVRTLILLTGLIYLGFYTGGCLCPIGAFQNLPLLIRNGFNEILIYCLVLTLLPVMFIPIAGRIFCGGVCPIGAIQEIIFRLGQKTGLVKYPASLEKFGGLKNIKYILLAGLMVFTALTGLVIFCSIEPFGSLFSFSVRFYSLIAIIMILLSSLWFFRPWCQIICPYGAFLALLVRGAKSLKNNIGYCYPGVSIHPGSCKKCQNCAKVCPVNAINGVTVDSSECISCGACLSKCKFAAIEIGTRKQSDLNTEIHLPQK